MKEETNKIGHLNMIQEVITRMGNNSFLLKQWSVGIMVAIYAFAGESCHKAVIVTIIPLIVFWMLDAYYLMLERKFRCLYNEVRKKSEEKIDYDMSFNSIKVNMNDLKNFKNSIFKNDMAFLFSLYNNYNDNLFYKILKKERNNYGKENFCFI